MTFDEFATRLQVAATKRVAAEVHREMGTVVEEAIGLAKGRLGGAVLNTRSGNLRRSITGEVVPTSSAAVEGKVRAGGGDRDVRYARIHELGGVIVPKNGKFLAIPTNLAPGGQTKHGPRDVPDLRFVPIRGGAMGLLVRERRGRHGLRSEILYILVRRVQIPKRPYMEPSVREATVDMGDRMREAMNRAVGAA